jgi:hypothetical protein
MNRKLAAVAALGALSLATMAPQAAAADNGFYLGAGLTQTDFGSSVDGNNFKIFAGFRPLDWLAVEANYIDMGAESDFGDSVDASALTLSGLLIAEVGVVDLYARLGVANWRGEVFSFSDSGWDPTFGAGIGAHFGSFGLRAEYETINASYFDEDTISLSFTYTFL